MREDIIPLHPERGLDPHLTFCTRCGGDTNELTIGVVFKAETADGKKLYANRGQTYKLEKKLNIPLHLEWTEVGEREKVPAAGYCDTCTKDLKAQQEMVKAGGIYFRCITCGLNGSLKKNEYTDRIRAHLKIYAPDPCVLQFDKCKDHDNLGIRRPE